MNDFPRTMRLSIGDKADFVYYQSKFNRKSVKAIEDSATEAAHRINSNADLNTTRQLMGIENAAHEIAQSNIAAAFIIDSSIQASTSRLIEGQNKNTQRVIDSLEDLRALFDLKLSETIFILEEQRDLMKEIIRILQLPLTTQAKELKGRAQNAFINGVESDDDIDRVRWFDNAIKDFEKSKEYNEYDFSIYLALGHIFLLEKKNYEEALQNYKDAFFYAKDYDYYKSTSLLYAGIANYELGHYLEAYLTTSDAIKLYPSLTQAHYYCAKYCSKLGRYDEAIDYLRTAIEVDRGYCLKALEDEDFEPMSDKFKHLMENLTREELIKSSTEIEKSNNLMSIFSNIDVPNEAKEILDEAKSLWRTGTYLNLMDAKYKARASRKGLIDSLIPRLSSLNDQFYETKENFGRVGPQLNSYLRKMKVSFPFFIFGVIGIIVLIVELFVDLDRSPLIYRLYLFYDHNILNSDEFVAHSISQLIILSIILTPISIPLFLNSLYRYMGLSPQKLSSGELDTLNRRITETRNNIKILEAEKSNLGIDKITEKLNCIDYEIYLRKTYG